MAAYLMLLALFAGAGFALFVIYSVFDDDDVPQLWALRIWSVVSLGLLLRIAFFAGSPWNIAVASFVGTSAIVYLFLCTPKDFWEDLSDKLDRSWNSAEYARLEREEMRLREENEIRRREAEAIRHTAAFEKQLADRKREAEEAKRREADRERHEAMRLKREAVEKARAEKSERERKSAIIQKLEGDEDDGAYDF